MLHVSKSIPLRSTLGIKFIYIIVGDSFNNRLDSMHELLSGKAWSLWNIEGQTILQHQFAFSPACSALQVLTLEEQVVQF